MLAVPDEAALLAVEELLHSASVRFWAIREPDAPWSGALMSIGILPQDREPTLRKLLKHLPLLR